MVLFRRVIVLRRPHERPLFSERGGYLTVIRLGFGWRVTISRA